MLQQQRNWYACYWRHWITTSPTNNSEFKTLILKKGINFCHQNFRGLYGNIDEVQEILLSHNFDIFSLSETSINEDFHNAFFNIWGYSSTTRDRKNCQVGGVGLCSRDGIDFARRPNLENDEMESLSFLEPFTNLWILQNIYQKVLTFSCQTHYNQLIMRRENQLSWVRWM